MVHRPSAADRVGTTEEPSEPPPSFSFWGRPFADALVIATTVTIIFLLWMLVHFAGRATTGHVDEITEGVAAFVGGVICLVVARRESGRLRLSWLFIGLGALCWAAGEGIWCWYDFAHSRPVPFPSLADVGFLAEVPLLLLGVLLFPLGETTALSRLRASLDGLIIGGSILAVSWGTVLGASYHAASGSTLSEAIALTYPIGDIAIATIAFSTLARTGRPNRATLITLIAAMLALSVSDSAYAYLTETTNYLNGHVTDTGWIAGFLLLGVAALWPRPRHSDPPVPQPVQVWQIVLPYGFLGIAGVFILCKYLLDNHLDAFLVVDGLGTVTIVLVRQVVTLLQDASLTRTLSRQARLDPLTGISNRLQFSERVNAALAEPFETTSRIAVLLCDLDNFKDVNDTLGHHVGDELLVSVADRLTHSVRPGDLVARLGGDEFAVVLENDTTIDKAIGVATRIIDAMQMQLSTVTEECVPLMSIGVALQTPVHVGTEDILRDADVALYAAKAAGGNCCRIFEPALGAAHFTKLRFHSELASALGRGELFVEYEPVIALSDGHAVGVEALVRWQHPTRGVLAPHEFLELAENSGAIVSIGQFVLEQALSDLADWSGEIAGTKAMWMAVNVAARQLVSGELVSGVLGALEVTDIEPSRLRLELTESTLVGPDETTLELFESLKAIGVQLTIDDFGTGYSSLSYLKCLPVDALKIDRIFVRDLTENTYDALIVEAVIRLARARGMEIVAEGIETDAQVQVLQEYGCHLGQGFYWSHPLRADEFQRWLRTRIGEVSLPTGSFEGPR